MLSPVEIMTEARWRCIYGDGYTPDGPNVYIMDSWQGNHVLIAAICYLMGEPRYYGRSTAEIALPEVTA